MRERSVGRRALLATGAAGLAALAGCSSLSMGDDEAPALEFDPSTLSRSLVADLPERPGTYPGPVPDELAAAHRRRARDLVDGVPADPAFPNDVVAERIGDSRESVLENLDRDVEAAVSLERLDSWRYTRANAAEVRGAYDAANGEVDAASLAQRRDGIRRDLLAFEADWNHAGVDVVDALAVAHHFEALRTSCRRHYSPDRTFPAAPTASVFVVGRLVGEIERARAVLDDLGGLRDAYRDTGGDHREYRGSFAVLARRLDGIVAESRQQVEPMLQLDGLPGDLRRDVEGQPAEELLRRARRTARQRLDEQETALSRGNDARACVLSGQALVSILALATVDDAVRDGEYGMPESAAAVRSERDMAVAALRDARSRDPERLATLLAVPAWTALGEEDYVFAEPMGALDDRDVVRLTAAFGLAHHLAEAVPAVHRRVRAQLGAVVDDDTTSTWEP